MNNFKLETEWNDTRICLDAVAVSWVILYNYHHTTRPALHYFRASGSEDL